MVLRRHRLEAGVSRYQSIPSAQNISMTTGKVSSWVNRRMLPFVMALGLGAPCLELFMLAASPEVAADSAVLKLRRFGDRVDVVVDGVTTDARVVSESSSATQWSGQLRAAAPLLLRRSQEVELSEAGLQSIRLSASGSGGLQLTVRAAQGTSLPEPKIQVDGTSLIVSFIRLPIQTTALASGRLDLSRPGRVQQSVFSPPMRARASAPPLGDMAVSSMVLTNRSYVNVDGPPVTLTLNNASAKDALMALARLGGYGFVYLAADQGAAGGDQAEQKLVSLAFKEESFSKAFNSVLLAAGLKGRVDGKSLLVGATVANTGFSPLLSKVYRLNQITADAAAQYLGSLGAQVCVPTTTTFNTSSSSTEGTASASTSQTSSSSSEKTEIQCYGRGQGEGDSDRSPIDGPLSGLEGTTDSRLSTVTLIGEPRLISVAENYLRNLDLRKRQVAVKVQIMSIDLLNDKSIDASFSSRIGNTFILSDSGKAIINFGTEPGVDPSAPISDNQVDSAFVQQNKVVPPYEERLDDVFTVTSEDGSVSVVEIPFIDPVTKQRVYVPDSNPNAPDQLVPVYDELGRPVYVPNSNPALGQKNGFTYPSNSLDGYLEAAIDSSSAKTLASPTLLVQEGEQAQVKTGTSVITGVSSTETANGSTQFENTRENAGLTLDLRVQKIDDNGFVTMNVSPSVSIPQPAGTQSGVPIFNITARSLNSGSIRLRDRQTLVLTGVIQDNDREIVRKWPILGDMPFIGQLFRSSDSQREKQELVILVTPSIVDDEVGGSYGYGYRPSTKEARQLMGSG